jgi:hypothetical protein
MIDPTINVHVGDTWTCHVCGRTRPDPLISVRKFVVASTKPGGMTIQVNVRYCNDTPACYEGTDEVQFLKAAVRAFG